MRYGGKDKSGRTRLRSIVGRVESPLRTYGPSFGQVKLVLLSLNHQKLYLDLFMFRALLTLKYILSNVSFAFALV
jgi:hypothetical protein